MAIINDELYAEVQRRVAPYLTGNVMDRAKAILEFCSVRSEEEVKGLLGFLNWVADHPSSMTRDQVRGTMAHDINGMHDDLMSPKSFSYAKFYKPETERSRPSVTVKCDNCEWQGPYGDAVPARDIAERIDLGGPYTDVECPDCGALAYP